MVNNKGGRSENQAASVNQTSPTPLVPGTKQLSSKLDEDSSKESTIAVEGLADSNISTNSIICTDPTTRKVIGSLGLRKKSPANSPSNSRNKMPSFTNPRGLEGGKFDGLDFKLGIIPEGKGLTRLPTDEIPPPKPTPLPNVNDVQRPTLSVFPSSSSLNSTMSKQSQFSTGSLGKVSSGDLSRGKMKNRLLTSIFSQLFCCHICKRRREKENPMSTRVWWTADNLEGSQH